MPAVTPSAPTRAQLEQIAEYLAAFWPALPSQHIAMNARGPKYSWVKTKPKDGEHIPLDQATLLAHAAGRRTIGAYLQDASGQARVGMIDVDDGGRAALVRCLLAAEQLGLVAYAIVMPGEPHDGGRLVAAYKEFASVDAIRAQMLAIVKLAGLPEDTEIWPRAQAVALPFAYHLRKRTRGELLLQTGESIPLDTDLLAGFAAVQALPLNDAPPTIEPPAPAARPAPAQAHTVISMTPRQQRGQRASLADVKAQFNAQHTLDELLIGYGAQRTKDGYTCPFCTHTHQTTLYISRQGRLFSFSPNCKLYTSKGHEPFGLYVLVEHNDNVIAALKALNPIAPRQARQEAPPAAEPPRQRTPEQIADAERKREARAAEAAEIRAAVEQRALQDERLTPCDRATLGAMLSWAAEKNSACCWLGRAAIAERAGYSPGSVKRSVMLLEQHGYFKSTGVGGRPIDTARRTFTRGSSLQPETIFVANDDPRIDIKLDHDLTIGACEPAPQPPATVAPEPEQPAEPWRLVCDRRGMHILRGPAGQALPVGFDAERAQRLLAVKLGRPQVEPAPVQQEAPAGPAGWCKLVPDFDDSAEPELASFDPSAAPAPIAEPTLAPVLVELDPLELAPPLPDEPTYGEFIWRYHAQRPGSIDKRTGKARAQSQRDRFRRDMQRYLVEVSPEEAALRWAALQRPQAQPGARIRAGVGDAPPSQARRAVGPPLSQAQQATLFAGAL